VFRAAQRAFRERKQTQLAELQARIRLYEQGEIERNVALQNVAKKLKDENEKLRNENNILRARVASCEMEHTTNGRWEVDGKRRRDDSSVTSSDYPTKRIKVTKQAAPFVVSHASPPSMALSPNSNYSSDNIFPSSSFDSPSREEPNFPSPSSPLVDTADFQRILKPFHDKGADCAFSAAVCGQDTDCFCREMALDAADGTMPMQTSLSLANFERKILTQPPVDSAKPSSQIGSILENLPAYQAPIPLRRRAIASTFNSVFPISEPTQYHSSVSASSATCSGDPTNCMACADDSFGQAFCTAIGESVRATPPCDGCPCCIDAPGGNGNCCVDAVERALHGRGISPAAGASATIPTNDAWRQLKSHPNVAFADLSLLADVVARRSKCTGPRVVISPPLGAATPERVDSPPVNPQLESSDNRSKFLTDNHGCYHETKTSSPSSRFVSRELLVGCGRQRVREVRADAVKEAMHMLDSKFSQL
jgi:AP-1-like transcription factor